MPESRQQAADTSADDKFRVSAPVLSLPKGGGAIKGIGEKFVANPVTSTGSMSVPIATSRGRSGFGPQLSLSYDSGSGNGPFGFGWSLALPSITRKTDKGLPQYLDEVDSDVFILCGAEDLMPVYRQNSDGSWVRAGMARDPGHYRWSSYRANGRGAVDERLQPHALYTQLGAAPTVRRAAYRALFRAQLDDAAIADTRLAPAQDQPLGENRFAEAICQAAGIRRTQARRGRPPVPHRTPARPVRTRVLTKVQC